MMREIGLMSEIKSPHVVSLKTSTKTANSYYLMMELLNGGDLQNYVKERGGYLKE
jgi:serine/threonine protein kinase